MPKSLKCPRCNGSVSISENAAGKRVTCPHCEQSFLAPGIATETSTDADEDDWLTLDDTPTPLVSSSSPTLPDKPEPSGSSPKKTPTIPPIPTLAAPSADDTIHGDDDDSFFSETSLPPRPATGSSSPKNPATQTDAILTDDKQPVLNDSHGEEDLLSQFTEAIGTLGAATSANGGGASSNPTTDPEAIPSEYESEFRVTCKTCGTIIYAKATESGKTTNCSDCYSEIIIPQPPKVRKKPEIDITNAETFSLGQGKARAKDKEDPFRKSADELLAQASREEEEASAPIYEDTPNIVEWLKNVFGIFKDPSVIMHWAVISVAAAIPTALLLAIGETSLQLLLTVGMMIGGLLLGAVTVSCAFAILISVANDNDHVEEWPSMDISQWLGQLIPVVGATGLVAVPMWTICYITNCTGLLGVFLVMLAIYLFLPFVLLSMLDMGSVLTPFSPELARSVSKCQEEWAGFYFSSGALFLGLFLFIALAWSIASSIGIIASVSLSILITFAYFGMLGRLAYTIGQSVNAPPMKNDVDRSRPSDPK